MGTPPARSLSSPASSARCVAALAVVGALLGGCGAKTGLDAPRPSPTDAGLDAARRPPRDASGDAPRDAPRGDAPSPLDVPELYVLVTADNSYRFGFGDDRQLRSTFGAAEAETACQIFCCSARCHLDSDCRGGARCGPLGACEDGEGAEIYRVPEGAVTSEDYLYVVAWSDDAVTQGLLVEIRDAEGTALLLSGDPGWAVCATDRDFDTGSGGPDDRLVAEWLGRCDRRWVDGDAPHGRAGLAIGEANDSDDGDFPYACRSGPDAISSSARWMWFDERVGDDRSAFTSRQPEFLIFRVPTSAIVGR